MPFVQETAGDGPPEVQGGQACCPAPLLERNRVIEISPAAGAKFDPHQHQAISVVPADQEANTVVTVLQKGYLISDRILRPALVTVAAPK